MRGVPVGREGSTVYTRSLRLGEPDEGQRVHTRPGDTVSFEAGAIVAELDAIDAREDAFESGYVPLAGVLSAWFQIGANDWPAELVRYALASARRLDMANELLTRVQSLEEEANADPTMPGPQVRRRLFNVLGSVELAVISLGRGISMILDRPNQFGLDCESPEALRLVQPALNAIRSAYEHIEDRALGTVQGKTRRGCAEHFRV